MKKLLEIIILCFLLCGNTYGEVKQFKGLFGIKLDDIYDHPAIKTIEEIKSINSLKEIKEYLSNYAFNDQRIRIATGIGSEDVGFIKYVEPKIKNELFDKYYVHILPLSGRIWRIGAISSKTINPIKNKSDCRLMSEVYEKAFNKYGDQIYRKRSDNSDQIWVFNFSNNNDSYEVLLFCNLYEDIRFESNPGKPEILVYKSYNHDDLNTLVYDEIFIPSSTAFNVLNKLKVKEKENKTDTSGL
jgi:hypothetical protein